MIKSPLAVSLFIGLFGPNFSMAQFTISGEIRPRAEYRHGFKSLADTGQDPAFFIDQRTRLNLGLVQEKYELKMVFQDVRTWGSQSQLVSNDGALTTIHEAWGKVKFDEKLSLTVGRQEINLDDQRIFGAVGWAQQARSHDAARVLFSSGNSKLDIGLAYNQDGPALTSTFYSVPNSYKALQYLWFNQTLSDLNASFLFLNNGMQGVDTTNHKTFFSQTLGTRLSYATGPLSPTATFYYQTGDEPDGITGTNAYQYSLDLTYKISENYSINAGLEKLSGNSQTDNNGKNNAFNPFYGTNHKFNGLMDYFYVGNHLANIGLQDFYLKVNSKLGKLGAQVHAHLFNSDGEQIDGTSGEIVDKYLGTELDFVFNYQVSQDVNLNFGYSQMFGSDSMELLKTGDSKENNNWAWAMLTFKPTFFTTKTDN